MGPIELLYVMAALVVLYIIGKLLGRLFRRSRREPFYRRGNEFDNPGLKAAQNAQKNYNDMQKRNANIRKQTDDTIRNMTRRSRGW